MAGQGSYEREVRDTIVKSGLTGVAATVLAVTFLSPAGFGDWVGASLASSFGSDSSARADDNPYANLPAYPAPLSQQELSDIRGQLASTAASLELTRAATDARIEHFRSLEGSGDLVTFDRVPRTARAPDSSLRLTLSEPSTLAVPEAPVESFIVEAPAEEAPASYALGGASPEYRDPHLELADLLLAHESY